MQEITIISITLLTALILVLTIWFIFKNLPKNTKPEKIDSVIFEDVKCPGCSGHMTPGYVVVNRGIIHIDKDKRVGAFRSEFSGALKNSINLGLTPKYIKSWICNSCERITIDYSKSFKK